MDNSLPFDDDQEAAAFFVGCLLTLACSDAACRSLFQ
jgi:hypothetical protein